MSLGNMTRLQSALLAKPKLGLTEKAKRVISRFVAATGCDAFVAWASCSAMAAVAAMQMAGWLQ